MKPLIIIQFPKGVHLNKEVRGYCDKLIATHPSYEFMFISEGVTLSIAHEGNITVTEVLKGE